MIGPIVRFGAHPYILLTFAALFWAASAVVARHVAGDVPPMALNFWRWVLAFAIALTWTGKELYRYRSLILAKWKYMSFITLTSAIGFGALFIAGLQYTTAINGALFQGMMSIWILVIAWVVLGDRVGPKEAIGIILAFSGLAIIVTRGNIEVVRGLSFNIGDIILLLATLSYGVYAVFLRRAPKELSSSALMTVLFGLASLYMLPLWLIEIYVFDRPLPLTITSAWSILYMGVCSSVLAQIFWATAVAKVGPGRAGYFIYLSPVFGVILAMILLGEVFRWFHAAGIVLIIAGICLATLRRSPQK